MVGRGWCDGFGWHNEILFLAPHTFANQVQRIIERVAVCKVRRLPFRYVAARALAHDRDECFERQQLCALNSPGECGAGKGGVLHRGSAGANGILGSGGGA